VLLASVSKHLLLALAGIAFAAWAAFFIYNTTFPDLDGKRCFCLFDDAMISMRYAWNLSHGNGLVWNAGEHVEGITNLLLTLLMALPTLLLDKCDASLAVQIFGAACLLAQAFFAMKIGEAVLAEHGVRSAVLFPVLFFAGALLYYPLAHWTLLGMETGLLASLLNASIWIAVRSRGRSELTPSLPILLGLLFLVRPDTAVPILFVLAFRFTSLIGERGAAKTILREGGIALAFAAGVSIFRVAYYGDVVPNTYTLKVAGFPSELRVENGWRYMTTFWESSWPLLLLATITASVVARRTTFLVLAIALSAVGYQIYVGGDAFESWRFVAGYMPLFSVLAVACPACVLSRQSAGWTRSPRAKFGMLCVRNGATAAMFGWISLHVNEKFTDDILLKTKPNYGDLQAQYARTGMALAEVTKPTATVAVTWAGAINYFSDRRGFDILGKADKHVAGLPPDLASRGLPTRGLLYIPGHVKYDLKHSIIDNDPTYIGITRWGTQDLTEYTSTRYKRYKYKGCFLWLRNDSPDVRWDKLVPPRAQRPAPIGVRATLP
jgi:hypothetical protein